MNIVRVPRTDPVYNAHGYLTKVPEGAIRPFLERYTKPGDTVLDPFAGSGMTGVAASILGRNAELSDISVLGRHIGENVVNVLPAAKVRAAAQKVVASARHETEQFYEARCSRCDAASDLSKVIWSIVYACKSCDERLVYFDLLRENKWNPPTRCPHCRGVFEKRTARRVDEVAVALNVACKKCGNKEERTPTAEDLARIHEAEQSPLRLEIPSLDIPADREMFRRSALGKNGHRSTGAFFSPRNAIALTALHRAILEVEEPRLRSKLLFAFTAILPRASKRYQWHHKRPLNAQNQTYYIAAVFYEWNVFELYARKVSAVIRADEYIQEEAGAGTLFQRPATTHYRLASADWLKHLPDESIDYVFTDPPFGSNLFYSDMSLFQEAWLNGVTDSSREAVIYTDRTRHDTSAKTYEEILAGALSECRRVLKPEGRLSIVFSNSRGEVWSILQRAIQASGFEIEPDAITLLDKGQRSVKGLASGIEQVVTADLVLTLRKAQNGAGSGDHPREVPVREAIADYLAAAAPENLETPSHAYLYVIRRAVEQGVSLEPFHLGEVLTSLHALGLSVDRKTGRLARAKEPGTVTR